MKKISLKKALEMLGFTNIEIHRGYNYRSGFMEKDGQTYYFATGDLRWQQPANNMFLMTRTAKDRKDFTGGPNEFWVVGKLAEKGYVLNIPLYATDYN